MLLLSCISISGVNVAVEQVTLIQDIVHYGPGYRPLKIQFFIIHLSKLWNMNWFNCTASKDICVVVLILRYLKCNVRPWSFND